METVPKAGKTDMQQVEVHWREEGERRVLN